MTNLEKLKKLTGESNEVLLSLLLEEAEDFVLSRTRRKQLIPQLEGPVRKLALIAYNRLGTEGESKRTEAGESYEFDNAPKEILDTIKEHRIARCGGHAHEKVETENSPPV